MKNVSTILFIIILSTAANAANITWNGAIDNDWSNNGNWVGSMKPGASDYAIINGAGFTVDITTTETIQGVRVINGTLNISASGNLTCNSATFPGIWAQGDVNNLGVITITNVSHAGIQLTNKTLVNSGTITINTVTQSGIRLTTNAIFTNNGIVSIDGTTAHGLELQEPTGVFNNNSGASLTLGGSATIGARGIFNRGDITINSGSTLDIDNCTSNAAIENSTGSTFTNGGTLTIGANTLCSHMGVRNYTTFNNTGTLSISSVTLHRIQNENASSFINSGTLSLSDGGAGNMAISTIGTGVLSNTGSIIGEGYITGLASNFTNTGTLAPGFSPGQQTFQNGFSNGTLEIELASLASFDKLVFSSGTSTDFNLNNTLDVALLGAYMPSMGDTYKIIDAPAGYTGTFTTVNYPSDPAEWDIQYNPTDVTLEYIGVVVPVELLSFEGFEKDKTVNLTWSTASEINNAGFQIEKSIDAYSWEIIGEVASIEKNSNSIKSYDFTDSNVQNGHNYYRLRQLDLDGNYNLTDVIMVDLTKEAFSVLCYPNPVKDQLILRFEENKEISKVNIYDQTGRLVKSLSRKGIEKIDVSDLMSGMYIMNITSSTEVTSQLIIKE